MNKNKHYVGRILAGFFSISFGIITIITKTAGRRNEFYLGEYALFIGGAFIFVGIFAVYRAFTKY